MSSDKTLGNDTTGVWALDSDAAGCWSLERDADGIAWLTLDKPATSANVLSSSVLIELDGVLGGPRTAAATRRSWCCRPRKAASSPAPISVNSPHLRMRRGATRSSAAASRCSTV